MAQWNDQEPYDGEVIIESLSMGHRQLEIERAFDGSGYRITAGNLFGSQSIHVRSAQNVLYALGRISKIGSMRNSPLTLKQMQEWPGFIRAEDRKRDDQT